LNIFKSEIGNTLLIKEDISWLWLIQFCQQIKQSWFAWSTRSNYGNHWSRL